MLAMLFTSVKGHPQGKPSQGVSKQSIGFYSYEYPPPPPPPSPESTCLIGLLSADLHPLSHLPLSLPLALLLKGSKGGPGQGNQQASGGMLGCSSGFGVHCPAQGRHLCRTQLRIGMGVEVRWA